MGKQQQNTLTPRRSVYNDLGLESNNISYDQFSKKFDEDEAFRKSVYGDLGFESQGIDYDKFYTIMGKPAEVPAQAAAPTSQTSVVPTQPTEPLNVNQTNIAASPTLTPGNLSDQSSVFDVSKYFKPVETPESPEVEVNLKGAVYDPERDVYVAAPLEEVNVKMSPAQKAQLASIREAKAKQAEIDQYLSQNFLGKLADRSQNLYNKMLKGVGGVVSGLSDLTAQALVASGAAGENIDFDQYMNNFRKQSEARNFFVNEFGAEVPKAVDDMFADEFIQSALGGVAESAPMMLPYIGQAAIYLQSYDSALESISNADVDNKISPLGKTIYAGSVGAVVGMLEKFGLDKVLKIGQTKQLSQAIANKAISQLVRSGAKSISGTTLNSALSASTKAFTNAVSRYGTRMAYNMAMEGFTEGAQEVATIGSEYIVNALSNDNIFDTKDLSTWDGIVDVSKRIGESAAAGAVGGVTLGTIGHVINKGTRQEILDAQKGIIAIDEMLSNQNLSENEREILVQNKAKMISKIENRIEGSYEEFNQGFTDQAKSKIREVNGEILDINKLIAESEGVVPEDALNALYDEAAALAGQIDEIAADPESKVDPDSKKVVPGLTQVGDNIIENNPELKRFEDKWVKRKDGRIQVFETPYEGAEMLYDSDFVAPELPSELTSTANENNQSNTTPSVANSEMAPVGEQVQQSEEVVSTPIQNKTIDQAINEPSVLYRDGESGQLKVDGQTVVFETADKIYELGNVNDVSTSDLSQFDIEAEKPLDINVAEDYSVDIEGTKYVNQNSDPMAAINYNDNGDVVSINLETENGNKRTIRGQRAQEIAYQYTLRNFEENATEQQIDEAIASADEAIATQGQIEQTVAPTESENIEEVQQVEPATTAEVGVAPEVTAQEQASNEIVNEQTPSENTIQENEPGEVRQEPVQEEQSKPVEQAAEKRSKKKEPTLAESLKTKESRQSRAQELRDRISAYRNSGNNLGIANDPKREASHWKDITDYAVIRIVDGAITTAENLAEELGIKLDSNVRKAFNDAKTDVLNNAEEYGSNTVTAAKNIETARKREVYGFGERLRPDVVGFDAVSNEADRIMRDDPYAADRTLNKAIDGEILNSVETVILTKYSQQLEDNIIRHNEIMSDQNAVEDVSRYNAVKFKREADMDKLISVYEALENTGTMAARALNIRKQTVIRDISLPGMLVQMRDAVGGRPLTEQETKEVSDRFMEMEKQRQAIQKRNEELETENARLNAEIELARQKYEVDLQRRRARTKQQSKTEAISDIKQRREEAKSALRDALGAIFSNQNVGFAMDPEQSARDQVKKDKALIKAVNGLIKTYVEEALVRFGKVEFDPIINKIYEDVRAVVPNITKEQVMNLIDSSNTDTRPTKTELQKEIGLFNKQLRLMNEIDKLENGGIFRRRKKNDPVTNATIEGLQKKLDELRRFMEDPNDVAARESARRDAQIENLTQQLKDLEEADVYTRKQRPESTPDPEMKNIRDEIARLKKEKADVNDKISDSKRSVQRRIDQLKKDIAEGNFQKERKQLVLDDPELNKMRKELDKLQFDFKVAAKKAEYKNRAWGFKVADALVETVAIPRTLMATGDLSAPLRQLIYTLPSRPIMAAKAIGRMFQFWSSKSAYENWQETVRDSELFGLAQKSGLSITGLVENVSASAKEEQFMSSFVDNVEKKIPILGSKGVKFNLGGKEFDFYLGANARAERGFTGAINKMRMDIFSRGAEILMNEGKTILTHPKEFKSLATYVNAVTGRGPMPKSMDGAMKYMSTVFFAPRLMSSRLWLLTGGPLYSATSPLVRKMYLRDTAAFVGFGLSVMAAATLSGMKTLGDDDDDWIGDTPVEKLKNLSTSVDFMNLKLGDRRYDVWGGFGQYVKFFIQEATGQRVTSTGNIKQLDGEGYNAMTRGDLVLRFGRSKLSPTMSLVTSALQGRNYMGEPFSLTKELANMSVPLVWQDTYEAWTELEEGPKSLATTFAPSFFGLGVQYWKSNKGMEFGSLPLEEKHKQLLAAKSVGTMAKDAEDIDIYDPETGGKRHPTGDEYKKYMDIWSDYIKSDLNENMEEYEKMSKQKFANRFNTIKSAATQFAKKELTGVSSFDTKLEYDGKTYMLTPDQVKQRIKDMDKYKKENSAEYDKLREQYISQGMAPNEAKIKINKKIDSDARSYTKDEMVQKLINNEIDLKEEN